MIGSPRTHAGLGGRIAVATGADVDVYLPEYRLAPEAAFPAATDDVFRAYRAMLARGHDPARVAIGGDSAGGALSDARGAGDQRDGRALARRRWS